MGGLGQPYTSFGDVTPGIITSLLQGTKRAARSNGRQAQAGTVGALVGMAGQPGGSPSGRQPVVVQGPWTGKAE